MDLRISLVLFDPGGGEYTVTHSVTDIELMNDQFSYSYRFGIKFLGYLNFNMILYF